MTLAGFRYCRPATTAGAIGLLASESGAVALAGGQSLLGSIALRRVSPALVVDIDALESALGDIRARDDALELGALTRQQELLTDERVRGRAPLLSAAARLVGNPQVRARGTVGGALAHRDPPAEIPAALAALGARVRICTPDGERVVALAGDGAPMDLQPGELVASVLIPTVEEPLGWAFDELSPRFAARPLVAVAAVAYRDRVCVAVAGLSAGPALIDLQRGELAELRPGELEASLEDRLAKVPPVADARASLSYRRRCGAALGARTALRATAGAPVAPPAAVTAAPPGRRARALAPADSVETVVEVNGERHVLRTPASNTLAELLRDQLELTATHVGCEHGVCGSCNVLVDGSAVRSCLMLAAQADGRSVETLEGLRDRGALRRLLPAFVDQRALQCGFCTPGMLVTIAALAQAPADRRDLREQLVGNLCRCTGYRPILEAAEAAR